VDNEAITNPALEQRTTAAIAGDGDGEDDGHAVQVAGISLVHKNGYIHGNGSEIFSEKNLHARLIHQTATPLGEVGVPPGRFRLLPRG
jgi:hypothetical protein